MHVASVQGTVHAGMGAFAALAARCPALWPALPVTWLLIRIGCGDIVYDAVAKRRTIVPGYGCDGDACVVKEQMA